MNDVPDGGLTAGVQYGIGSNRQLFPFARHVRGPICLDVPLGINSGSLCSLLLRMV
jgi:hypothetical protein